MLTRLRESSRPLERQRCRRYRDTCHRIGVGCMTREANLRQPRESYSHSAEEGQAHVRGSWSTRLGRILRLEERLQVEQHLATTPSCGGRASTDPLKVIIADDDAFVRRLVKEALQAEGITVIAEASNGRDAVELTLHYEPDAVLMDVLMPGLDGIAATRQILAATPEQSVILLTGSDDEDLGLLGLRAGASGFLTKDQPVESLTRALWAVSRGEAAISRHLATRLVEHLRAIPNRQTAMRPVSSPLTTREWEVLTLIEEKRSNAEIADSLVVSMATVRSHVKSILRKLGVHSREEAVQVADRMREGQTKDVPG